MQLGRVQTRFVVYGSRSRRVLRRDVRVITRARALVPPVMTVVYPYYVYPCIMYLYFVKVEAKL